MSVQINKIFTKNIKSFKINNKVVATNIDKQLLAAINKMSRQTLAADKKILQTFKTELKANYLERKKILAKPNLSKYYIKKLKMMENKNNMMLSELQTRGIVSNVGSVIKGNKTSSNAITYSQERYRAFGGDDKYANFNTLRDIIETQGSIDDWEDGSEGTLTTLLIRYGFTIRTYKAMERKERKVQLAELKEFSKVLDVKFPNWIKV